MNEKEECVKEELQEIYELQSMTEVLRTDVEFFMEKCETEKNGIARRAYIRAVFAFIEGLTYALKRAALANARVMLVELTNGEIEMINETAVALDERGEVIEQDARIGFLPNIIFSLTVFTKSCRYSYKFPVGEHGWGQLRKAQKIRNRLVHPKYASDFNVSDSELEKIKDAFTWYLAQIARVGSGSAFVMLASIREFSEKASDLRERNPDGGILAGQLLDIWSNSRISPPEGYVVEEEARFKALFDHISTGTDRKSKQ